MESRFVILHNIALRLYLIFLFLRRLLDISTDTHRVIDIADGLSLQILSMPFTLMSDNTQLFSKSLTHAHILTLFLVFGDYGGLRPLFVIGG